MEFGTWESLSSFRAIVALRIGYYGAIVVPVFAYAILEWNQVAPRFKVSLPPTLFALFLGSATLAIAHLLNEVLCPQLIKVYGNHRAFHKALADFVHQEQQIFAAGEAAERLRTLSQVGDRFPDATEEQKEEIAESVNQVVGNYIQTLDASDSAVTDYEEVWKGENNKWPPVRWFIVACYGFAGLIALALTLRQLGVVFLAVSA